LLLLSLIDYRIDTPGVINRVSELFAGHPNLIQGFNTFLPPGYRIECGANNDPNTIRVTTPMGTTVQSIAGRGTQVEPPHGPPAAGQPFFRAGGWPQPQHSVEGPETAFNTATQNGPVLFNQAQGRPLPFDGAGELQRQASSQAQSSAAGLTAALAVRNTHTPTPTSQGAVNGSAVQQANLEKRGPVEFNHAISYVNKIKVSLNLQLLAEFSNHRWQNRFQDKPEIYKQFLEILQTYQRESKAITDVYAQVTALFHGAPDLLEDFKQFLPDTSGQVKSTPGRPGEEVQPQSGPGQTPQPMARDGQKMPPLGSFAPPGSAGKETKKRPRTDKAAPPPPLQSPAEAHAPVNRSIPGIGTGNKRAKHSHKSLAADVPSIEPSLTPVMPEPIPPPPAVTSMQEEIAFFDRVKKYLGNRAAMNEFLKLCNLFSQQIIDRSTLYHKGTVFLSANPDLHSFWKSMLDYEPQDTIVDNKPAPPTGKVSLSNCRGYGPSYRLLPQRVGPVQSCPPCLRTAC
jgi:paired amphipathic helix protein Sin3a